MAHLDFSALYCEILILDLVSDHSHGPCHDNLRTVTDHVYKDIYTVYLQYEIFAGLSMAACLNIRRSVLS